jgi:hypothetical protein
VSAYREMKPLEFPRPVKPEPMIEVRPGTWLRRSFIAEIFDDRVVRLDGLFEPISIEQAQILRYQLTTLAA